MAEAAAGGKSGKVVIQNIGLLLSGDLDRPILDADTIVVNDGLIRGAAASPPADVYARLTAARERGAVVAGQQA